MKQYVAAFAVALCVIAGQGLAQGVVTIPAARPLTAPAPPLTEAPPPARTSVRIPEGTEVRVQFDEQLSSATASSGDTFSISTDEDIRLSDGTIIRAGYRGKGEVTSADKNGLSAVLAASPHPLTLSAYPPAPAASPPADPTSAIGSGRRRGGRRRGCRLGR